MAAVTPEVETGQAFGPLPHENTARWRDRARIRYALIVGAAARGELDDGDRADLDEIHRYLAAPVEKTRFAENVEAFRQLLQAHRAVEAGPAIEAEREEFMRTFAKRESSLEGELARLRQRRDVLLAGVQDAKRGAVVLSRGREGFPFLFHAGRLIGAESEAT